VHIELLPIDSPRGLRVIFEDEGPGIPDIELAMQNGFTTGNSLGHGLAACRNMVNFFELLSEPGKGTRVEIQKWC
jgi:serine/threonine-protein kinase RsbT